MLWNPITWLLWVIPLSLKPIRCAKRVTWWDSRLRTLSLAQQSYIIWLTSVSHGNTTSRIHMKFSNPMTHNCESCETISLLSPIRDICVHSLDLRFNNNILMIYHSYYYLVWVLSALITTAICSGILPIRRSKVIWSSLSHPLVSVY